LPKASLQQELKITSQTRFGVRQDTAKTGLDPVADVWGQRKRAAQRENRSSQRLSPQRSILWVPVFGPVGFEDGLLLENGTDPGKAPDVYPDEGELYELVTSYGVKPANALHNGELVYLGRGDKGGNPESVKRLLRLGADVNHQDHKGKTALHRAAKAGFTEALAILLDHGATVVIEDQNGETPCNAPHAG